MFGAAGLCCTVSWAQDAVGPQGCSDDVQEVLAAALQYGFADVPVDYSEGRFDPKSRVIPNYSLLHRDGRVYFRSYVSEPTCSFGSSLLPTSVNAPFELVDDEHLRQLAQLDERGVPYLRATHVRVRDDEAVVGLGAALRLNPRDERGLQCCCAGDMVLQRAAGKWRFVEWKNIECL